jgi:hypothetical protein
MYFMAMTKITSIIKKMTKLFKKLYKTLQLIASRKTLIK